MSDDHEDPKDAKLNELRNRFRTIDGGAPTAPSPTEPEEKKISEHTYAILDINGQEWLTSGFLIFTSHHVAIMRETDEGAVPVFVMPLDRVCVAEMVPESELEEAAPF